MIILSIKTDCTIFFLLMFFSFLSINIKKNCLLVYVVDKKNFCEVRNSKELFTNSSPREPRIRQCWFYFFRFAFLHAFLGFDKNKFGRPVLLCFFSWGCKVLINCPSQKAKFRGGILSSSRIYMRKYLYPDFWKPD